MNNQGKIFLGFLAGAAVGAIAGILLAPETGEMTRQSLSDASLRFKEDINNQVQKGIEKINSLRESAFSLVNSYGEEPNGASQNNFNNGPQNF